MRNVVRYVSPFSIAISSVRAIVKNGYNLGIIEFSIARDCIETLFTSWKCNGLRRCTTGGHMGFYKGGLQTTDWEMR